MHPIPKSTPGETRPLALLDDIYSYIADVSTKPLKEAIISTGLLYTDSCAYQKAKGVPNVTEPQACLKEDAFQHKTQYAILEEDQEKFFDRILLELQCDWFSNSWMPRWWLHGNES